MRDWSVAGGEQFSVEMQRLVAVTLLVCCRVVRAVRWAGQWAGPRQDPADWHEERYNTAVQGGLERQDPGTVAGLSIALMAMAFSAAFTGAVLAPALQLLAGLAGSVARARLPLLPKQVFDTDYQDNEYEDSYNSEEENEAMIDTRRNNKFSEIVPGST